MKRSGLILAICFFASMLCPAHCHPATRVLKTAYKTFTIDTWQGINILCEPYKVQKNDWIYKIFRKKGNLSEIDFPSFLTIFKHLNPHISHLDNIRPGQEISIPLKKIAPHDSSYRSSDKVIVPILQMSELSPKTDMNKLTQQHPVKTRNPLQGAGTLSLSVRDQSQYMEKIRRYATIVQGQLLDKGTYYLPGPRQQKDIELKLANTPIIQLKDNAKIIILPHDFPRNDLLRNFKGFWQNVSFMDMDTLEKKLIDTLLVSVIPKDRSSALALLVQKAKFNLLPYETTLVMAGGIKIPIKANRVARDNQPDLLIFLGRIYGNALTILKLQGYSILSISPDDQVMKMGQKLFGALGLSTIVNPVFMNRTTRQSISIPGLFVGDGKNLFLSSQPLGPAIQHFLAKNRIVMLYANENQPSDN